MDSPCSALHGETLELPQAPCPSAPYELPTLGLSPQAEASPGMCPGMRCLPAVLHECREGDPRLMPGHGQHQE